MKLSHKAKKNFEEDNQFYIDLGKKLRAARKTKVNEFTGKETVVTQTRVKYEKGENRIPLINLVKISKFLNKPLSYFIDDFQETEILSDEFNNAFKIELEKLQESK
jgi:transcriptional regulator with XRE-family HTH domain